MAVKEITTVTRPNVNVSWWPEVGEDPFPDPLGGHKIFSEDGLSYDYISIIENKRQWQNFLDTRDHNNPILKEYNDKHRNPHRQANNFGGKNLFIDLETGEEITWDEVMDHLPD